MIWEMGIPPWVINIVIYIINTRPLDYWESLGVKQTNPWQFLGDLWPFVLRRLSFAEFVERVYNLYPNARYMGCYQLKIPTFVLRDPELIKQILVKDFDHFIDRRSFINPEADPLWGRNLADLKGQKWRDIRASVTGSFTSGVIRNMFHLLEEAATNFVQYFLDKNEDIIEVEMKDTYTRYTSDVIATAAFGIKCDSLVQPDNDFYVKGRIVANLHYIKDFLTVFCYMVFLKPFELLKDRYFNRGAAEFFKSTINETIKTREETGIVRSDIINVMLEARNEIQRKENEAKKTGVATLKELADLGKQMNHFTNDAITSQALIFFFAGVETISKGMCFGSYELATNTDVQEKLRKEIKETYEKVNGKVTYDILLNMKYMDMVVSEILRKWPPIPVVDRVCTKQYNIEPVTPDEKPLLLIVGDVIWLPIQDIHRDPSHYENPKKFDPERFSNENKDSIKPYTYMPFGTGPRNCIGSRFALLEIKALLFNLLLNFEIVPTKKTQIPLKLNKWSLQQTAEGGFWLGLKRIKN